MSKPHTVTMLPSVGTPDPVLAARWLLDELASRNVAAKRNALEEAPAPRATSHGERP